MLSSSEEDEQATVYCICKSTDVNRFMIGCDGCTDWFHGSCVNVTEKEAKYIKKYYCPRCRRNNPTAKVVYKSKYKEVKEKEEEKEKERRKRKEKEREERRREKERRRQKRKERERKEKEREERKIKEREKERKRLKEELEQRKAEVKVERHSSTDSPAVGAKKREQRLTSGDSSPVRCNQPVKRSILKESNFSDEDVWQPPAPKKPKSQTKKKPHNETIKTVGRKRTRYRAETSSDEEGEDPLSIPRQCYGPNCIKLSRVGSKYCSDQCGINMATSRIYRVLPERVREWNLTTCASEIRNRKALDEVRDKQSAVKSRLEQLHSEHLALEELIGKGKTLSIEENSDDDEEESGEMTVHCVTCGANVQVNTAIRHMERCYNKIESQTSFASKFKTQIEDDRMFCDYYNQKEQTYCKRLKVLCPEHNPDPKITDDEVCGYPLQKELFSKETTSFCLRAKKTCLWHFSWEKLRRAEIDMEKVKQWMKVDELLEQERALVASNSNRAGVLGLMLHSTFNHELDGRIQAQRAQMQRKLLGQQKFNQKPIK